MSTFSGQHSGAELSLGAFLVRLSKLPEPAVADALEKGAVTLQRGGKGKILRERNPELPLRPGDKVVFHYDKKVLSFPEFRDPELLGESKRYGVWYKPAGILSQGNQFGDHTSLLRAVERVRKNEVFLVHRLDRETAGVMIVAYDGAAASALSELFQKNAIEKSYEAVVLGSLDPGSRRTIDASLDGKKAITHIEVLDTAGGQSLLRVGIETGRLHQIRRHLDFIGFPVMGDPKYGRGNKNRGGLQLLARSVKFTDPWTKAHVNFTYDGHLEL